MYTIFDIDKRVSKPPTTQIAISAVHISYTIENFRIVMMSKGTDIQWLYNWLRRPVNKALCIASHWGGEILHLNLRKNTTIY